MKDVLNDPNKDDLAALSEEILRLSYVVDNDGTAENINKMVKTMVKLNILCENYNLPHVYDAEHLAKLRGFASSGNE